MEAAYALNRPLRLAAVGDGKPDASQRGATWLVCAAPQGVIAETVKRAADGDGLIVRVYESRGSRCGARLECAYPVTRMDECDLLERPLREGESPAYALWQESRAASHDTPQRTEAGWAFTLRPYEIRTFRLR